MDLKRSKIWRMIAPYWKTHNRWLHNLKTLGFSEEDIKEIEIEDEEELTLIKELEEDWKKSQTYYSDKELLEIFPEVKKIIPEKIKECNRKIKNLTRITKEKLGIIKKKNLDKFSHWFWREWIKINEVEELLETKNQLARFKYLFNLTKGRVSNKGVTQEKIQQAMETPIETIAVRHGIQLTRRGKTLIGLCPFHQEKNPSFNITPEKNLFYCHGCREGGNIINFVKLLYGFNFPEAVRWIIGEQ